MKGKMIVYRNMNCYNGTDSIVNCINGGSKQTATSPEMVRKIQMLIKQNTKKARTNCRKIRTCRSGAFISSSSPTRCK